MNTNFPPTPLCPHCGKSRFRMGFSTTVSVPPPAINVCCGATVLTASSVGAAPQTYNLVIPFMEYCTCTLEELDARITNAYTERDKCIALLTQMAQKLGLNTGIRTDDLDPSWPIVYIDLPSGQVSWHVNEHELPWFAHLPLYEKAWDGHATEEKYERVLHPELEEISLKES